VTKATSAQAKTAARRRRIERTALADWRQRRRGRALKNLARLTFDLRWSPAVFSLLLEELQIGEEFEKLVGDPARVPIRRYPQALALAVVLRNSWRPDLLAGVGTRLGLTPRAISLKPSRACIQGADGELTAHLWRHRR
jgi:hypothetical protein